MENSCAICALITRCCQCVFTALLTWQPYLSRRIDVLSVFFNRPELMVVWYNCHITIKTLWILPCGVMVISISRALPQQSLQLLWKVYSYYDDSVILISTQCSSSGLSEWLVLSMDCWLFASVECNYCSHCVNKSSCVVIDDICIYFVCNHYGTSNTHAHYFNSCF